MKALLDLFNPLQTAGVDEEFDAIRIGIASPDTIRGTVPPRGYFFGIW